MPEQIVPITGFDTVGLIEDVPPVSLPPNAFSDCRNVRFRDGSIQKMGGELSILPNVRYGDRDILKYIVWWPNPNLAIDNLGYYLLIVQQGTQDNAYLIKVDEAGTTASPLVLTPTIDNHKGSFRPSDFWQHTFFQGGFSLIINNGLETPHFILDGEENTATATVPNFMPLPGWASYAVDLVNVGTVTAGVVRSYGDFLVAGNLIERDADGNVIRALPNTIRSSDIAAPGTIPQNWNPFNEAVNTADEFTVTGDGIVQDFVQLQGNMYIYSNSSISVMSRTGNPTTPLSVRPVTDSYGALTTDSVIEFDGRHFVVGSQDIYIFGGHPGSIASVGDSKVRRAFYDNLSISDLNNLFVMRYQQRDEIWLCYPSQEAVNGRSDTALVWNYRNNTWTKKDLPGVVAGDVGPIPGGGLPSASLEFTGTTTPDDITPGVTHINRLDTTQTIRMRGTGQRHGVEITIPGNFPALVETGNPVLRVTLLPEFWTGGNGCPTLRFIARGVSGDDYLVDTQIQLPQFVGILPGNPQSVPYGDTAYATNVLNRVTAALTAHASISNSPTATTPLRIHTVAGSNIAFDLEFNNDATEYMGMSYTPVLEIVTERSISREEDLDVNDRPLNGNGTINNGIDVIGEIISDNLDPSDRRSVFSFDFSPFIADITDYVFFFKGAMNANPTPATTYNTYMDLATGFEVFRGVTSRQPIPEDGGNREDPGMMDGGMLPGMGMREDGTRRILTDFSSPIRVNEPLFGSEIAEFFAASDLDVTELAFLLSIPGVDNPTALNLIAYTIPKASDGIADYNLTPSALQGGNDAAILSFAFREAIFDKNVDDWIEDTSAEVVPIDAILAFNDLAIDDTSPMWPARQRNAFADIIRVAFEESTIFGQVSVMPSGDSFIITAESLMNAAYTFTSSISGGERVAGGTPQISDFGIRTSQQGIFDFTNTTPMTGERRVVAPCIRIIHTDPNFAAFNFDTGLIDLRRSSTDADPNADLTPADWLRLIDNRIQELNPGQWTFDPMARTWTSTAVTASVTEVNPAISFNFPAEKDSSQFTISSFSAGNGNRFEMGTTRWTGPTSVVAQEGVYEAVILGSHLALNMSNGITYLFYIGGTATDGLSVAQRLRPQLATRLPQVQVLDVAGGIAIEPAVLGDNTLYVVSAAINGAGDELTEFNRLISSANFTQDPENVSVVQPLPDSLLNAMNQNFPSAPGLTVIRNISAAFDVNRTWSSSQVNFAVEYPIFAAGHTFPSGRTSNAFVAADIGFNTIVFQSAGSVSDTGIYNSFVERAQMALAPEFTTELLQSIALWTDGVTTTMVGNDRYNRLQLSLSVTNDPGQSVDLTTPTFTNMHYISEDYKMDTRITGRFLNWRLSDISGMTETRGNKDFQQDAEWRLSGLQLAIRQAGRR